MLATIYIFVKQLACLTSMPPIILRVFEPSLILRTCERSELEEASTICTAPRLEISHPDTDGENEVVGNGVVAVGVGA
jgi:hypothetical protein